jgi:phosphocarrier protein
MIEETVEIINKAGLHTRPSATIVKLASKYKADFFISKDGLRINGKSIIGVMTLAAGIGAQLHLEFNGVDEEELAKDILDYFKRGFDEL